MTKSGVAYPKFQILVFSPIVNYEKLVPSKYFTLFVFMFILKLQLIKFKRS